MQVRKMAVSLGTEFASCLLLAPNTVRVRYVQYSLVQTAVALCVNSSLQSPFESIDQVQTETGQKDGHVDP